MSNFLGSIAGTSTVTFPYYTATTSVRTNPATDVQQNQMQLNGIAYHLTPVGVYHRIVGFKYGESPGALTNTIYADDSPVLLGELNLLFTCIITGLDSNKIYYFVAFGIDQFLGYWQSAVVRSAKTRSLYAAIAGTTIISGSTTICPYAYMDETIDGEATVGGTLWKIPQYEEIEKNSYVTGTISKNSYITISILMNSAIKEQLIMNSVITYDDE